MRRYAQALLLEEPIPVNYYVVGTQAWLDACVPLDACPQDKRIVVVSDRQLDGVHDELIVHKALTWDCESTGAKDRPKDGLDAISKTSRLLLFQVGTADKVFVLEPKLLTGKRIKAVMENDSILHIGHNATFDFKMLLMKYGIHVVRIFCTMLGEQLLTAGKAGEWPSLLALCRKYPPHRLISKGTRGEFVEHSGPFTREQIYYAARDIVLPFPVATAQIQKIKDLKLDQIARDEMECIACTAEMELGGFILNQTAVNLCLPYYREQMEKYRAEVMEIWNEELKDQGKLRQTILDVGPETFDINSAQKLKQALQRIGLTVANVSKDTLEDLDHRITEPLLSYSKYKKLDNTYGENLFSKIHPDDGRFHPTFDQLGAGEDADADGRDKTATIATGRYSSDTQQMPKHKTVYTPVTRPEQLAICQQLLAEHQLKKAA